MKHTLFNYHSICVYSNVAAAPYDTFQYIIQRRDNINRIYKRTRTLYSIEIHILIYYLAHTHINIVNTRKYVTHVLDMKNSILCADFDFYYLLVVAFLHVLLVNFNFFFFIYLFGKNVVVLNRMNARALCQAYNLVIIIKRGVQYTHTLNSHVSNLCADFIFHIFIAEKSGALRAPALVEIKFIFFQLSI